MNTATTIPTSDSSISVFGCTDVGRQRPDNEDAFLVADLTEEGGFTANASGHCSDEGASLLVVADGMGGAAAGEVASSMAVDTLREVLTETPVEQNIGEQLKRAAETANESIWTRAQQDGSLCGMGSTLTAALVRDGVAYIAQVGDSRAYLIRGERIRQLTKDQSLVQLLIDIGDITPEQAAHHPRKNLILQALGASTTVKAELTTVELCRDDRLILCSDGLSNVVEPTEIQGAVTQSPDPETACRQLVELANGRGGEDNITVIVARFSGENLCSSSDTAITGSLHIN
jgi:serine/threonine protein phosphatase PrpC